MKKRTVLLIVVATVLVHAGAFLLLKDAKPLPKRRYVPPPNFTVRESKVVEPGTGDRLTFREFTVSTRLVPRPELR